MSGGYSRTLAVAGAPRLLVSSIVARLPLGMSLAILLLVRDTTGSFAAAGLVVGAFGLAAATGGPLLGRLVDHVGQPRVLVPSAGVHSALLVALVGLAESHAPTPWLVLAGALAGACLPPVTACLRALWPEVAPDAAARESAFALDATVQEVIWTAGPLLVGGVVALAAPSAAVLLMAFVTATGTLWFATAPRPRAWRPSGARQGGVLRSAGMLVLLAASAAAGMSMGSLEVGLPRLAEDLGAPGATGALLALASVGSLAGGLIYGGRSWTVALHTRLSALCALAAALTVPLALAPTLAAALVLAPLAGLAWAPALSCIYALVGALAPAGTVTEAFTWNGAAVGGGIAVGVAIGGWLVDISGAPAAFGCGVIAAGAAAVVVLGGRSSLSATPSLSRGQDGRRLDEPAVEL